MNRMVKGKRVWLILAMGLIALLLLGACAPAPSEPANGKKVVEIGYMSPFTGPGSAQEGT